ncbi:MAG: RecX family transcriptional regulator [Alicyclobacillus sp.]|nr:RecX family transcriptional regulator [Alicyclobacillus sp.]
MTWNRDATAINPPAQSVLYSTQAGADQPDAYTRASVAPDEPCVIVGREPVSGRSDWLRVLFDQHPPLMLPVTVWTELGWQVGKEVLPTQWDTAVQAARQAEIRHWAFLYLQRMARTRSQLLRYLIRRGAPAAVAEAVVCDLAARGYVDDAAYARALAEQLASRVSRRELAWRLRQRGVERSVTDAVLAETRTDEREAAAAQAVAERYWQRHSRVPVAQRVQRLAAYLQRRGFDWSDIRVAVQAVSHRGTEAMPEDTFLDND